MQNTGNINLYKGIYEYQLKPYYFNKMVEIIKNNYFYDYSINWKGSNVYKGLCLNYNDDLNIDKKYQYNQDNISQYDNTWLFDKYNYFGNLLGFLKPFIRSKYTILNNEKIFYGSWHTDESPEDFIRLVIPIAIDNNYYFQQEGMKKINFEIGNVYHFDTRIPHRVLYNGKSYIKRECLVLCIKRKKDIHPIDQINNLRFVY